MIKAEDRRSYSVIATTDLKGIKNCKYNDKSRFTPEGLRLHIENKNIHECMKASIALNNRITNEKEIVLEENVNLVDNFFEKAANLCKKRYSFKNNAITLFFQVMVVKQSSKILNL